MGVSLDQAIPVDWGMDYFLIAGAYSPGLLVK
jgi:hypothetical protein